MTKEKIINTLLNGKPMTVEYTQAINWVIAFINSYETQIRENLLAILIDIQLEIEEMPMHYDPRDVSDLIQEKINALKGADQ